MPSNFRSFGRTRKYGTLVPSLDVAKCCSMTCLLPSKNAGLDFSTSGARPISAIDSVVGVRKSVAVSHTALLSSASTAPTPTVPIDGAPTNADRAQPSLPGVSTDRRFFTSSMTLRTRWSLVHA